MDRMLSTYISAAEFELSQTAIRKGIVNHMTAEQRVVARHLCIYVLDLIREHYGMPLLVSSGFRCSRLNMKIGGSPTSQHMIGEGNSEQDAAACDFNIAGKDFSAVYEEIKGGMIQGLVFDQVIHEGGWVHISRRMTERNRMMCLLAHFGPNGVSYTEG